MDEKFFPSPLQNANCNLKVFFILFGFILICIGKEFFFSQTIFSSLISGLNFLFFFLSFFILLCSNIYFIVFFCKCFEHPQFQLVPYDQKIKFINIKNLSCEWLHYFMCIVIFFIQVHMKSCVTIDG